MTDTYDAYHCVVCDDTGTQIPGRDATLADSIHRGDRPCYECSGFGVVYILTGRRPKPGRAGERWPERDIQAPRMTTVEHMIKRE
jgi:hypothetical protein